MASDDDVSVDLSPLILLLMFQPSDLTARAPGCAASLTRDTFGTRHHDLPDGRRLRLSRVEVADASEVIGFLQQTGDETDFLSVSGDEIDPSVERRSRMIELGQEGGQLLIKGAVDGEMVALLSLERGTDRVQTSHVGRLALIVRRSHWRRGIGRHLMRAGLDWARAVGLRKVNLEVIEENHAAIRLYASLGFVVEGVSKDAVWVKGQYKNFVLMSLLLPTD